MKILHTADLHLGMKFAGYPEVQQELCQARFATLERLVETANAESCDLFVIAGDLFDRVGVAKRDIIQTVGILNRFEGKLVLVLPGNHDYLATEPGEPWTSFRENSGDRVVLLTEKRVYPLTHYNLDAAVYPAPCDAKHSSTNYLGWIGEIPRDEAIAVHIGVAHGSLKDLSPDFDRQFYPMTKEELEEIGLDLWLLGHTHLPFPSRPGDRDRIFYSATPEPDGFDCRHPGHAWLIEIGEDKKISPVLLTTGRYHFLHDQRELRTAGDLERLIDDYSLPAGREQLLKLKLTGQLAREEYDRLPGIREQLRQKLFYLQWDGAELSEEITPAMIEREFTAGSFPHRLLTELAQDKEDFEALQKAYHLLTELKQ